MSTDLTPQQVCDRIRVHVEHAGGVRALARKWGVSAAYISDLQSGRRGPGPAIAKRIGVRVIHIRETRMSSTESSPDLTPAPSGWLTMGDAVAAEDIATRDWCLSRSDHAPLTSQQVNASRLSRWITEAIAQRDRAEGAEQLVRKWGG